MTPGAFAFIARIVIPFSPLPPVRTATAIPLATCASGTKNFSPVIVYSLPLLVALSWIPSASKRPEASAIATVPINSPLAIRGSRSFFCWSEPPSISSGAASRAEVKKGPGTRGLARFFDDHRHVEEAAALTAVTLRDEQPGPSELDQLLPEGGVVRGGVRHLLADKLGRAVVGQKALGRVPKHLLFFRKSEIQLAFLRFVDGESCGLKPLRSMFQVPLRLSSVQAPPIPPAALVACLLRAEEPRQ